ncbi:MAG: ATP-dependent DNA helicase PcrA [Candidatus Brennerbacteria bacterium CG11_big_fil_rev_8_21_14_0_20_43_10]|uniref:DNA 3'-5' helicase n=2 Tax=Candidatus Brenneribacteriota TaxID=1817902 RepID=A0A2H9N486_9BACT|nr:MAG: ATP-dependent DNA helicase PcrA [Candidatus Brennerbacteria bacterium CG11_big_fil_rev_8_21_14_0_20_43_10]PIX28677.1 MAG: ATP-dependent DNA helicase PcrA [Candidatus Brennerbacteria bacterium CG_4_8_14_3_um_filter_43_14]
MAIKNDSRIILMDLNDQQKQAVLATKGPVLIVAGAGSGKTKTLTYRVAYLISSGVTPESIVALTFTNKAAGEMKQRIMRLLGRKKQGNENFPFIGTFHKFALSLVKQYAKRLGYTGPLTIYDESDSVSLMRQVIKTVDGDSATDKIAFRLMHQISYIKNKGDILEKGEGIIQDNLKPYWNAYETMLRARNAIDFDNIILDAVNLVQTNMDIRERLQNRFRYFCIDEFQDTNTPQYALMKLLAEKHKNICAVGDDWQSIYSFRCADFTHLLKFERDWPGTRVFFLEQNYRSTQTILDASHGVISQNVFRTQKKLFTRNPDGDLISIVRLQDERAEAFWIMEKIQEKIAHGKNLSDCVILFRTNVQSRVFEELCMERNVAYQLVGTFRFYQRREIQDLIAYARVIHNPLDTVSLSRIINVPRRGIGQTTIETLEKNNWDSYSGLSVKAAKTVKDFQKLLDTFRTLAKTYSVSELLETIATSIKYRDYLDPDMNEGKERWENVQELIGIAKEYGTTSGLARFLENVQLMQGTDSYEANSQRITLMTLHSVKGLEFPIVFIAGVEERILPHERSVSSPEQLEEERRLLYVGMTRAKQELYLTCAHNRLLHGEYATNPPSRFLRDIPERLTHFVDQSIHLRLSDEYGERNTIYL